MALLPRPQPLDASMLCASLETFNWSLHRHTELYGPTLEFLDADVVRPVVLQVCDKSS